MRSLPMLLRPVLALLLVVPLAACGNDEVTPSGERPLVVEPDTLAVASGVADPTMPRILSVVVEDGVTTGDTGVVQVKRNAPMRIVVISDQTDTLLVQGYDLRALATAETPVQLDFIASRAGEFPVVLEKSGRQLLRLRVG